MPSSQATRAALLTSCSGGQPRRVSGVMSTAICSSSRAMVRAPMRGRSNLATLVRRVLHSCASISPASSISPTARSYRGWPSLRSWAQRLALPACTLSSVRRAAPHRQASLPSTCRRGPCLTHRSPWPNRLVRERSAAQRSMRPCARSERPTLLSPALARRPPSTQQCVRPVTEATTPSSPQTVWARRTMQTCGD